jgi:hypothetical protein
LAKNVRALKFVGYREDLEVGVHPFTVSHPGQAHAAAVSKAAGHYDEQQSGMLVTSADRLSLHTAMLFKLPSSYLELTWILRAFHTVLEVLLGTHHALVSSFGTFLANWDHLAMTLAPLLEGNVVQAAGFMRRLQLLFHVWFKQQIVDVSPVAPPKFDRILDHVREGSWVPLPLPLKYLEFVRPKGGPPPPSQPKAAQAPARGGAAALTSDAADKRGWIRHNDAVAGITLDRDVKIPDIIAAAGEPPVNASGGIMCLGWHVRGGCRHECTRSEDHRAHTPPEHAILKAYLAKAGRA